MTDPASIRLLILDVDGVLTDGSVLIDADGRELKRFNVRDGAAIRVWLGLGLEAAVISGRASAAVEHRMKELGVGLVLQGRESKSKALDEVLEKTGIPADEAAFVGDDWQDLPAMRRVGYPVAVADAHPDVIAQARYVSARDGGRAAVREIVEHFLSARGMMRQARALYDHP